MTPASKAKELVDRYWLNITFPTTIDHAKQCAIICAEEILRELHFSSNDGRRKDYFESVKQEISNL